MKQNIYEIRQRSEEMLRQAIAMWRQSAQSDSLEGLEKDPVFSMLISAIAYQYGETENEIELIKANVVEEFAHLLAPYELGHPIPATIALQAALVSGCPELDVDTSTVGKVSGTPLTFIPILHTRVINAQVGSMTRIDGRRWRVTVDFEFPVTDLSRFCFSIKDSYFEDLKVSCNKVILPLIRPWNYAKLPLARCFSSDCALYNNSQYFNASMIGMELFARQNLKLFCIKEHHTHDYLPEETMSLDFIFEFTGIADNFVFDKSQLLLNTMVMAEAKLNYVTLSTENPVVRLAGYDETSGGLTDQFLHLVRPSEDQLYRDLDVTVRRISADRFNQATLTKLLSTLLNKYHSDFYAFRQVAALNDDHAMEILQDILHRMLEASKQTDRASSTGVYAMLHKQARQSQEKISLALPYLTTHGAGANDALSDQMKIQLPSYFNSSATRIIANPVPGSDEISDKDCEESLMRYRIVTNDRVVTPADIKLFCYTELKTRYGIDESMVSSIDVSPRPVAPLSNGVGYEILAEIMLKENSFVKRNFEDRRYQVEQLMQKMMEVRSTSIYPIRVSINIESSKK